MDAGRGTIGDKPWGAILGALGASQRTAEIVVRATDAKTYRIRLDRGVVVAASSPLAVDAIARVALTNRLIAAIQVKEITRRLEAAPERDEIEVLAEVAGLDARTAHELRLRALTQRAARTFAVDQGEFTIADCEPMPSERARVPIQAVVFVGARLNLSEDRLRFGLRQFAARFVLRPKVSAHVLSRFQLTPKEHALLDALRVPTSLAELEASHREIDPRGIQAVVYALASCGALAELDLELDGEAPLSRDSDLSIPVEEEPTRPRDAHVRAPSQPSGAFDNPALAQGTPGARAPSLPDVIAEPAEPFEGPLTKAISSLELETLLERHPDTFDEPPTTARDAVPTPLPAHTAETVRIANGRAMLDTFKTGKVTLVRPNALRAHEVVELLQERTAMIARGADHFTLLGVGLEASVEDIHAAYVELARNLGAKRLRELGISDQRLLAEGVLAQLLIAFTVLTDRVRRAEYMAGLAEVVARPRA